MHMHALTHMLLHEQTYTHKIWNKYPHTHLILHIYTLSLSLSHTHTHTHTYTHALTEAINQISFETASGVLTVTKHGDNKYEMQLPLPHLTRVLPPPFVEGNCFSAKQPAAALALIQACVGHLQVRWSAESSAWGDECYENCLPSQGHWIWFVFRHRFLYTLTLNFTMITRTAQDQICSFVFLSAGHRCCIQCNKLLASPFARWKQQCTSDAGKH